MVLVVELPNYGVDLRVPFTITVQNCVVTAINVAHPGNLHISFEVGDPEYVEPIPAVYLSPPGCQEPVLSLYDAITGQPQPWAVLDLQRKAIVLQTDDFNDTGSYYIVLLVETSGESTADPAEVVY